MILLTKTQSVILFGANFKGSEDDPQKIVNAGLCIFGKNLGGRIKLLNLKGGVIGKYEIPNSVSGQLLPGRTKNITIVREN